MCESVNVRMKFDRKKVCQFSFDTPLCVVDLHQEVNRCSVLFYHLPLNSVHLIPAEDKDLTVTDDFGGR